MKNILLLSSLVTLFTLSLMGCSLDLNNGSIKDSNEVLLIQATTGLSLLSKSQNVRQARTSKNNTTLTEEDVL